MITVSQHKHVHVSIKYYTILYSIQHMQVMVGSFLHYNVTEFILKENLVYVNIILYFYVCVVCTTPGL